MTKKDRIHPSNHFDTIAISFNNSDSSFFLIKGASMAKTLRTGRRYNRQLANSEPIES